jgi:hypothetical protein
MRSSSVGRWQRRSRESREECAGAFAPAHNHAVGGMWREVRLLTSGLVRVGRTVMRTITVPLWHRLIRTTPGVTLVVDAVRATGQTALRAAYDEARESAVERARHSRSRSGRFSRSLP